MKASVLLTSVLLLGLTACQTMPYQPYARAVKQKPSTGGIVALKLEHRPEDRQKAESMMKSVCGTNPVKIVEEGEVAIGQETKSSGSQEHKSGSAPTNVGTLFGLPITSGGSNPSDTANTNTVTTSVKEWQISYECQAEKTATNTTGKSTKKVH
ncbi:MAG: hypothetical protein ACXVCY_13220 [Pseudobdellovibrionaceae bacterium]